MFEMMADPACIAHAACGDDDFRDGVRIDRDGFLACDGGDEIGTADRVDALLQKSRGFFLVAVLGIVHKDFRRVDGERTVDIDRETVMPFDQSVNFDLSKIIEDLLRSADRESGNDHVSSAVESALDDGRKKGNVVFDRFVISVSVGGFHHDVIGVFQIVRVPDQRLALIPDIAGEDDFPLLAVFVEEYFDGGGAEQVSCVGEAYADPLADVVSPVIAVIDKVAENASRVVAVIQRLNGRFGRSHAFPVLVFRFLLLNVRAVQKHDLAQAVRCDGGVHLSFESVLVEKGKKAGVIDVGVGQEDIVDVEGKDGKVHVFINVFSLLHTVIDQDVFPAGAEKHTAARDFVCRTDECQLHRCSPVPIDLNYYHIITL